MENQSNKDLVPVEATGVAPIVVPQGEAVAERHVHRELRQAKKSLLLTQVVSVAVLLLTASYMTYMTMQVRSYAQPEVAAEVANGIIAERVDLYADQAAQNFKGQIPQFMSSLPDQALAAAPQLRENVVTQVESRLTDYSEKYSDQLGGNLDEFLDKNKDQIGAILKDGQDKKTVAELGPQLELQLLQFLEEKPEGGGESAQTQINKSLAVLTQMKQRTDKLAAGKNLTPEEQKTRLAIAIIGQTINRETKGLNSEQLINEARKNISAQLGKVNSPTIGTDDGLDSVAAPADSQAPASDNAAPASIAAPAAP